MIRPVRNASAWQQHVCFRESGEPSVARAAFQWLWQNKLGLALSLDLSRCQRSQGSVRGSMFGPCETYDRELWVQRPALKSPYANIRKARLGFFFFPVLFLNWKLISRKADPAKRGKHMVGGDGGAGCCERHTSWMTFCRALPSTCHWNTAWLIKVSVASDFHWHSTPRATLGAFG